MKTKSSIAFASVLLACGLCVADRTSNQRGKSKAARSADTKFTDGIEDAAQAYSKKVDQLRQIYIAELRKAMKEAMIAGELEEANGINAAIHHAEQSTFEPSLVPSGVWELTYSNGAVKRYRFNEDSSVDRKSQGNESKGKLVRRGQDVVIEYPEGTVIERLTLAQGRLFVEYWDDPVRRFPSGTRTFLAVGKSVDSF